MDKGPEKIESHLDDEDGECECSVEEIEHEKVEKWAQIQLESV